MHHGRSFALLFLVSIGFAAGNDASAQIRGTEISVSCVDGADWDNIVVSRNGVETTITCAFGAAGPAGVYGPTYAFGAYVVEPFWAQPAALPAGHLHIAAAGGNAGAYEAHHSQGATERQGYHIARADGQSFDFLSIDYRNAQNNLLVKVGAFANTATFDAGAIAFGPAQGVVLNDATTWRHLVAGTIAKDTEISISSPSSMDWDNVVLHHAGVIHKITFDFYAAFGPATYGPQFVDGDYIVEPFWTTATGLTTGHDHVTTPGGNPGAYESHHAQGTDYQGYHIRRIDNAAFELLCIDYRNAQGDFYIKLGSFFDTASFALNAIIRTSNNGLVAADPNWRTLEIDNLNPIRSTQIAVSSLTAADWDNFRLLRNGIVDNFTFTLPAAGPVGPMNGATYPFGGALPIIPNDYVAEPFWTSTTALVSAHHHVVAAGGNPGDYESHHAQGTDYQGFCIRRIDGEPLELLSIDYRSATGPLLVTSSPFNTTGTFAAGALSFEADDDYVFNDPNWRTYTPGCVCTEGAGQAPQLGLATLDITGAREICGAGVLSGVPGPYYSTISPVENIAFTISGAPNQPFVVIIGNLAVATNVYAGIGQLDLAFPVVVVFDGTQPGLPGALYWTGPFGVFGMSISVPPNLPPNTVVGFQAAVYTGGPAVIALSNAVELTLP